MDPRAEFVYWDGGARYVPLLCAPRQVTLPLRLVPSHAGAPQDTSHCSHQHCELLYGGCEHCPFCSTAPPLQLADDGTTRRQSLARLDPFLRVLQKNLDNAVARVHLQSGLADRRDLVNDYSVQRAQARVFSYRQKLGLDPPARPENMMELILRIPTRIKVFRVRNKGYYCHAIALLCGPPVQPYMVSVLEEVSTGALFSAGRMIDVKFRVECPQYLSRKRVLGLLGKVAEVTEWKRMLAEPGEMDKEGLEYAQCLDAELVTLVSEKVTILGQDQVAINIDVEKMKTLVFQREYISDPLNDMFWWIPVKIASIDQAVDISVYTEKDEWKSDRKYEWAKKEGGKKRMFQEKRSELDTNFNSGKVYHKWDLSVNVTRENINFTAMCDYERRSDLEAAKNEYVHGLKISPMAKDRIKAQLTRLHSEPDVKAGVHLRQQTLTATNGAIIFLQQKLLTPASTRNVVTVFMSHVDIWPVHWSPSGLQWQRLGKKPAGRREINNYEVKTRLHDLMDESMNDMIKVKSEDVEADAFVLESDYFVPCSSEKYWVQVVEGDGRSRKASSSTNTWIDHTHPPLGPKSLFSESMEVMSLHYEGMSMNEVLEGLVTCIVQSPSAELECAEEPNLEMKDLFLVSDEDDTTLTTKGVNWLLLKLSDDNYVDYLFTNNQDRSKTLVFPLDFYQEHSLTFRGDQGAAAFLGTNHTLSDYHTLIIPGKHPDCGLFFAYVSLERGGRIFAYSMETGQVCEGVRQDLLHFVNSCLLAEFEDNRGRITGLNFDSGQPFYAAAPQWKCDFRDQNLLLLACTRYVLDRRMFDFDPGSTDDMNFLRFYFIDLIVHNAR